MAKKIQIKNVRGAFLNIFEAQDDHGFNGKFIISPDHPQIKEIEKAINDVAKEKWGDKAAKIVAAFSWTGKKPDTALAKDEYRNNDGDTYDGFEDMWYISAKGKSRPAIFDRDRTPLSASDGVIYAGCHLNIIVEIWAQDNKYGKAVRAELKGVQFLRDGDAFGGGAPVSADEFDKVEDADDSGFGDDLA